jgi:hypothetical protein
MDLAVNSIFSTVTECIGFYVESRDSESPSFDVLVKIMSGSCEGEFRIVCVSAKRESENPFSNQFGAKYNQNSWK